MAETKVAVWDRWDREYGDKGPRWASRRGPGWFGGLNVWPYLKGRGAGCIGPRPGLRRYTLTSAPNGSVGSVGFYVDTGGEQIQFSVGTALHTFTPTNMSSQAVGTATGAFAASPGASGFGGAVAPLTYWTVRGEKSYTYNTTSNELEPIADSPGGRCMVRHGDRFFVGDTGASEEDRVYYSEPADFADWPVLNFFEVDYSSNVLELLSSVDRLIIQKGIELWALSGTVGTTAQLRKLWYPGGGVADSPLSIINDGGEFSFVTKAGDHPGWTNGAIWDYESQEQHPLSSPRIYYSRTEPTVMTLQGGTPSRMVLRRGRTWTPHTLGYPVSMVATAARERFVIGRSSSPVEWSSFDTSLHRPAFTNDDYARPGDDSTTPHETCYLHLPEFWSEKGRQLTVREVKVDFVKWNTGAATNHFDVTVEALSLYDAAGGRASATLSFDEAGSSASTSGVEDHRVFGFGDQGSGTGYQIRLDNLRGVGIRRVVVTYTEQVPRTR